MQIDRESIRRDLYKKYKFISNNISVFENIIFSNVYFNEPLNEIYSKCIFNIEHKVIEYINNKNVHELISEACKYLSVEDTLNIFNNIFNKYDADYSLIDLRKIYSIDKIKNKLNMLIYKNKASVESYYFEFTGNKLLGVLLENYYIDFESSFSETENDKYFNDSAEKIYIKEISKFPSLSREEELELFKRIEQGDEEAKTKVIESNLRYVYSYAFKYKNKHHDLELMDIVQYGNIGLMEAFDYYDYRTGNRFLTYATSRIYQLISYSVKKYGRAVRIPAHTLEELSNFNKVYSRLRGTLLREPTLQEIAGELNVSLERAKELNSYNLPYLSFDQSVREDETESSENYYNFIYDDRLREELYDKYDEDEVNKAIEGLLYPEMDPMKKKVIIHALGLYGAKPLSLVELKEMSGYSHEWCRQIVLKFINNVIKVIPTEDNFKPKKKEDTNNYIPFPKRRVTNKKEYFLNRKLTKNEYEYHNKRFNILQNIINASLEDFDPKTGLIEFKCDTCNYRWRTHYDRFKLDLECPSCKQNDRVKYYEDYIKTINNDLTLASGFVHLRDKVKVYCNRCGHYSSHRLDSFVKNGCKCATCREQNKSFVREIYNINNVDNLYDNKLNTYGYVNVINHTNPSKEYFLTTKYIFTDEDLDKLVYYSDLISNSNNEEFKIFREYLTYNEIMIYLIDNGFINYKMFDDVAIASVLGMNVDNIPFTRTLISTKLDILNNEISVCTNKERLRKKLGE